MDTAATIARWFLGLVLLAGGINELLRLRQVDLGRPAGLELLAAMKRAPVIWRFLHLVEVVAGVLLLLDVAAPFALVLVAPVVIGIALFHLEVSGLWYVAPLLVAPGVVLAIEYWPVYEPLFSRP